MNINQRRKYVDGIQGGKGEKAKRKDKNQETKNEEKREEHNLEHAIRKDNLDILCHRDCRNI